MLIRKSFKFGFLNVRSFFHTFFRTIIKMTFTSRYENLRNEEEFLKFSSILDKVLKRRGIERKKHRRDLEDYFCYVRAEDQLRAKDQLKELFSRIRELKKENRELKKLTEAVTNEVLIQRDHCNQDTKQQVLL